MDKKRLISTAKYAGTSITLGTAITALIVFAFPVLKEVNEAISALIIFAVNVALSVSGVITEE